MLICISLLTGLRSLQDNISDKNRLSLQLSTLVTSVASFHYFYMLKSVEKVISYRYFDWFFTTPILLIDLCLLLFTNIPKLYFIIEIIFYNTLMLGFGYLGEINKMSMINSMIIGFIPFVLIFYKIYNKKIEENEIKNIENKNGNNTNINTNTNNFVERIKSFINNLKNPFNNKESLLFYSFIFLWSLYGITHILPYNNLKQTTYNVLDLITKGFFGLYIYYNSW